MALEFFTAVPSASIFAVSSVSTENTFVGLPFRRYTGDGMNANETTSEALTDMGGGATFYDVLVEVAPA